MKYAKLMIIVLCFSILISPLPVVAVDTIPPIPVSDSAVRDKEVGVTVFGYTVPGLSFDSIAIMVAKKALEHMVDSTVSWINSGFDGNPAYVTNPKQYFTDMANKVAGEFIEGSDLNVLCSPFQAKIRLALTKRYNNPRQYQCKLTTALKNLEGFYNNFDEGGWQAWFDMTQNSSNNPYGAYLEAQLELDARLAEKVGLERELLNYSGGFLSMKRCRGTEVMNQQTNKKECIGTEEITTPGGVIEGQLANVLGTGVRQLELADEFDELVGTLINQLLQRTVFSIGGLRGSSKVSEGATGYTPPPGGRGVTLPNNPAGGTVSGGTAGNLIDIDGDGTFDGVDSDGDGMSDSCFFGETGDTSNTCRSSTGLSISTPAAPSVPVTPVAPEVEVPSPGQVNIAASATSGKAPLNNILLGAANGEPGQYYYYFYCDRPESDLPPGQPPVPSGFNNTPVLVTSNKYTDPVACSYSMPGTYRPKVISFKFNDESDNLVTPLVYREAWTTVTVTAP